MFSRSVLIFTTCFLLAGAASASAETQITPLDAEARNRFGYATSISGDFAIIGASQDNDLGHASGSAYIFERIAGTWTEAQKLVASDGAADDYFGNVVSIDGNYAIVGADLNDANGTASGAAYIYERVAGVWTETRLTPSDGEAYDHFGSSVSIHGDYAVVGAMGNDWGAAYIFERIAGVWTEVQILKPSDLASADAFADSVAISGDYAFVASRLDDDGGNMSGSVYVFERSGGVWPATETQKLTASDAASDRQFGQVVSVDGDYAIIGVERDNDGGSHAGAAYVFERIAGTWTEVQKLTASDAEVDDYFGLAVSIHGNYALVGAYGNDDAGDRSGSAYIFERIAGTWTEGAKLTASDGAIADYFGGNPTDGNPVSIDGQNAIVGAQNVDVVGVNSSSGAAYIYDLQKDSDSDSLPDLFDNCLYEPNAGQEDSGGVASPADPSGLIVDGIGDACQCGDVTDDGIVTGIDGTIINRWSVGLPPGMAAPEKCTVIGPECNYVDSTVIVRSVLGLPPGIQQLCEAALP